MNNTLTCKYVKCSKYMVDPILLECTNNVCKCHVDELIEKNNKEFKCFVCNDLHEMPNVGFVMNKALSDILSFNLHLNENEKLAADLTKNLQNTLDTLKIITNDPENFIFEYISNVRNKIDLERVRLVDEINSMSNEMLNKLKQFEDECKLNIKNFKNYNEELTRHLLKVSNDISKWNQILRTPNTKKKVIDQLIDDARKLLDEIEEEIFESKNILLVNKKCTFNAINKKFDHKLFGNFYIGIDGYFKSKILSQNQTVDLIKLCEFNSQTRFKLLYRASRDGFLAKKFHSKCDGKPNTLTIIKVKGNSNVFGGFVPWAPSKTDQSAFIFSLINKDNMPLKINVTDPSNAIIYNHAFGPIFGYGDSNDFVISNNSNVNLESYSRIGVSYKNDLFPTGSAKAQNFLAGSSFFSTQEIEVYQII